MKPRFVRRLAVAFKRLGKKWRRPRGLQSKQRKHEKSRGRIPLISYSRGRKLKYLHPCGLKELIVNNLKELEKIDSSKEAIKIAHGVGEKKRQEIIKKAGELKIKVLNP